MIDAPPPTTRSRRGSSNANGKRPPPESILPEELPPHHYEAERNALGSALISSTAATKLTEMMLRQDFFLEGHGKIFDAIRRLLDAGNPVDVFSVMEEIRKAGALDASGEQAKYIQDLAEGVPHAAHVEYYARIVVEKSVLRQILWKRSDLQRAIDSGDGDAIGRLIGDMDELWKVYQDGRTARRTETITLQELLTMEFPEPKWAVPGILPEGLNLLVAKSKIGKSWMAYQLGLAIVSGGIALGSVQVQPGEVLCVMLEDTHRRMQNRCRQLMDEDAPGGTDWHRQMHLAREWERMDGGGKERLIQFLRKHPQTRFVVIDTLERFRAGRSQNGNAYAEDYAALVDIKAIADEIGVCVLLIHHENKGGKTDFVDSVSGSAGIPGAADSILVLKKERMEKRATMHVTGRDIEERTLALEWDDRTAWTLLGEAGEVTVSHEQEQVLQVLRIAAEPLRHSALIGNLVEKLGIKPKAAEQRVSRMVDRGLIVKEARLYWLPRQQTEDANTVGSVGSVGSVEGVGSVGMGAPDLPTQPTQPTEPTEPTLPTLDDTDAPPLGDELPEELAVEPDDPDAELRHNAFRLGWTRRYPASLDLGLSGGESDYRIVCRIWDPTQLRTLIAALGGAP